MSGKALMNLPSGILAIGVNGGGEEGIGGEGLFRGGGGGEEMCGAFGLLSNLNFETQSSIRGEISGGNDAS
jgi:hypothetical protein